MCGVRVVGVCLILQCLATLLSTVVVQQSSGFSLLGGLQRLDGHELGEIPARRWPMLMMATLAGAVSLLDGSSWLHAFPSLSTWGNPRSGSLDWRNQRHGVIPPWRRHLSWSWSPQRGNWSCVCRCQEREPPRRYVRRFGVSWLKSSLSPPEFCHSLAGFLQALRWRIC